MKQLAENTAFADEIDNNRNKSGENDNSEQESRKESAVSEISDEKEAEEDEFHNLAEDVHALTDDNFKEEKESVERQVDFNTENDVVYSDDQILSLIHI